jgi:hypothetical protein
VEARRNGKWMHYRWAKHGDPLIRHVLTGLREWMAKDDRMNGERRRRNKVCCRTSPKKSDGTKKNENERIHLDVGRCAQQSVDLCRF